MKMTITKGRLREIIAEEAKKLSIEEDLETRKQKDVQTVIDYMRAISTGILKEGKEKQKKLEEAKSLFWDAVAYHLPWHVAHDVINSLGLKKEGK